MDWGLGSATASLCLEWGTGWEILFLTDVSWTSFPPINKLYGDSVLFSVRTQSRFPDPRCLWWQQKIWACRRKRRTVKMMNQHSCQEAKTLQNRWAFIVFDFYVKPFSLHQRSKAIFSFQLKNSYVYSQLSLNEYLIKADTSLKQTRGVGPCRTSVIYFIFRQGGHLSKVDSWSWSCACLA